jgi:hypothetical protein
MNDIYLMTSQEAAAALRLHKDSLRRWRSRGFGPPYIRISPTRIMYDAETLQEWITLNTVDF